MENIYIALVDTPGIFAALIRRTINIPYIHTVLSIDSQLNEAYTFGRRNPFVPYFSGFVRENPRDIIAAFPDARYKIIRIVCSDHQKKQIIREMQVHYENRNKYHYCMLGLPFLLAGIPFHQKRHYTCSSFIARELSKVGIWDFNKHFSLVTPKDFYESNMGEVIFEGYLYNYLKLASKNT